MTGRREYSNESETRDGRPFHLDDERCERVRDCLKKAGIRLAAPAFDRLVRRIEASIGIFQATEPALSYRQRHDALRTLWRLAHESDPRVGVIRAHIKSLPKQAMDYIDYRAPHVVPRLEALWRERRHAARHPPPDPSRPPPRRRWISAASVDADEWQKRGGFRAWASKAPRELLVEVVATITAEGGRVVPGRSRGAGKREKPYVEPLILGVARGAPGEKPEGGRPSDDARQRLVRQLACDWLHATKILPESGRSDHTGFGDLVHSVFQWIESSPDEAEYVLRQYWKEVQSIQSRPIEGGMECF